MRVISVDGKDIACTKPVQNMTVMLKQWLTTHFQRCCKDKSVTITMTEPSNELHLFTHKHERALQSQMSGSHIMAKFVIYFVHLGGDGSG